MNKSRLILSRILVAVSVLCVAFIAMSNAGVINVFSSISPQMTVTITGCINAFKLLSMSVAMILCGGKYFWLIFAFNLFEFATIIRSCFVLGFEKVGAGLGFSIFGVLLIYTLERYMKKIKEDEFELDKAAYTDQLTGCLNRRGMMKQLAVKAETGKNFYLAFLDLDNFKQINDTLGHDAGDELLIEVSTVWARIRTKFHTTICRLGGDEFAIIIESSDKNIVKEYIEEVLKSTSKLQSKFSNYITTSAGLAHYTADTNDLTQLLSYADTAMYKAKLGGKNDYFFFDQDMYQEIIRRYLTEKDLKDALKNDTFTMMYQPQYEISTHKLVGFESLIRLKDKQGNFINTQDFIKVAEKSGLIYEIDLWVLKNVMKQTADYVRLNPDVEISINISGKHITNPGFVEAVIDAISETGFQPVNLKIEITESSYIKFIDEAITVIQRLKVLGIKTALDDFGTGYSSLNYLSKMPVDLLKIDKSFVDEMLRKQCDLSFVDIIIKLGHLMDCKVIAEGVEYNEQLETLATLGCDYVQGYIWGKPVELEKISDC